MKIFLSYSSKNHSIAEQIALALRGGGHDVFYDDHSLEPGDNFHDKIRGEIQTSDLIVFLITPSFVTDGKYTRSEIEIVRRQWPAPTGHVLPVMLETTKINQIPAYLKAVTLLKPKGNPVAEIIAHVAELDRKTKNEFLNAKNLWLVGTSLVSTADHGYPDLKQKLKRGHTIRVLVVDPEDTLALQVASKRSSKGKDFDYKQKEIIRTLERLCGLRREAIHNDYQGRLEIKTIRYALGYGVHAMNPESDGILHVKLYPSPFYEGQKPTFVLSHRDEWYESFKQEMLALWAKGKDWNCGEVEV